MAKSAASMSAASAQATAQTVKRAQYSFMVYLCCELCDLGNMALKKYPESFNAPAQHKMIAMEEINIPGKINMPVNPMAGGPKLI